MLRTDISGSVVALNLPRPAQTITNHPPTVLEITLLSKRATTMSAYTPTKRKLYTLIMPLDLENKRILLGYKKRGFGMGKCESRLPLFR